VGNTGTGEKGKASKTSLRRIIRPAAANEIAPAVDVPPALAHCRRMWLSADEQTILQYLKLCGTAGASAREICRKASTKDRWKEEERWAYPVLSSLKDKRAVETTPSGNYILPPESSKKKLGER